MSKSRNYLLNIVVYDYSLLCSHLIYICFPFKYISGVGTENHVLRKKINEGVSKIYSEIDGEPNL